MALGGSPKKHRRSAAVLVERYNDALKKCNSAIVMGDCRDALHHASDAYCFAKGASAEYEYAGEPLPTTDTGEPIVAAIDRHWNDIVNHCARDTPRSGRPGRN